MISAKKYSAIFRALYNSSYLLEENSQKIISFLAETEFRQYLNSALPKNTLFAHKIGVEVDKKIYLDPGIVYAENRPYILTVMIKSESEETAQKLMKDISQKASDYINNYQED